MSANKWHKSAALALALVCLLSFLGLAVAVVTGHTQEFDSVIRTRIHDYASPTLTIIMRAFSFLGSLMFLIPACVMSAIILRRWGQRRAAGTIVWEMAGAILLENILKYSIHRARPEAFFGNAPDTYSFPSGHALFALCFYGAVAIILFGWTRAGAARTIVLLAVMLLISGIGVSRIYLGVHYPSDVLGGYLAGVAWLGGLAYWETFASRLITME